MAKFLRATRLILLMACGALLGSCGGGGTINNDLALRMINALPDSPPVNFLVDGVALRTAADYKGGTGLYRITPGSYDLAFEAILPGDDQRVADSALSLSANVEYTVIAIGKAETDSIQPLVIENPLEDVPDGSVRLQVVHAAPDAPPLAFYVTAAGASLPESTPLAEVSYGQNPAPPALRTPGNYVIRVTPAGDPGTVLFDSGTFPELVNRDDLMFVVVKNTVAGPATISLLVANRVSTFEANDVNATSDMRVVHVSPDAPALDVVGDPASAGPPPPPNVVFASGLTYLGSTGYVAAPPDTYLVSGYKSSDPNATTPPFSFSRVLFAGQRATVMAIGLLASINGLQLTDDIRPLFALGKLRVVDASPASAIVDVYIVATGTDIAGVSATLSNLTLSSATGYLAFTPGNYTVSFTKAGTKEVVATQEVVATGSTVQTAILVDAVRVDENSNGEPAGVLLLNDLAAPPG